MDTQKQKSLERNLRRYRKWLHSNAVASIVRGFLPTFLDDQSKKIHIVVDESMQPRTDGSTIIVSLIPAVLEDEVSEEDWMIILKAAAAHEAQHVNSSNFSDISKIRKWYGEYLNKNCSLDPSIGESIAQRALNIVEDGRIERIAAARRPGMFIPFRYLNQIIRNGTAVVQAADNPEDEYRDFWGNILSYAKTGLYSPGIQAYAGTQLETVFLGIRHFIDTGIESRTSDECRQHVQELLEKAAPYICDLIKKSPNLEASLKGQDTQDEYTSNQGTPDNSQTNGEGGNPLRVPSPSAGQDQNDSQNESGAGNGTDAEDKDGKGSKAAGKKQDSSPEDGESGGSNSENADPNAKDEDKNSADRKNQSKNCSSEGDEFSSNPENTDSNQENSGDSIVGFAKAESRMPPLSSSELNSIRDMAAKALEEANKENRTSQSRSSDALDAKSIEDIRAQYTGKTLPVKQDTIVITGREELPSEMKTQALMLRREIIRVQDARSRSHKGLRRGMLDQGALWKTGFRDDRIFMRKAQPDKGSVVFYLLIDNSGSMRETTAGCKAKYQAARSAAAVIEEAVKGIVPCKIVLFDQTGCSVNHMIIKSFDDKSKTNCSWNSLTKIGPGGCNADSVNIRIAGAELARRPEKKKVLLVLSDGTPSAYGSRAEAYTEVTEAVSSVCRKGTIVIPIMFGDSNFLSTHYKKYVMMYEKNIVACEPREITERLSGLFRQIICR